jgi:hypothetical protein
MVVMQLDAALGLTCNNTRVPLVSATGAADDIKHAVGGFVVLGVPALPSPPPQLNSKVATTTKAAEQRATRTTAFSFLMNKGGSRVPADGRH